MAYNPPRKNAAYIFYVGLVSRATGQLQANPTIAAGDFKVSTNGGALGNLGTLPAVTPAGSKAVKVTLSAAEMNGDNVVVIGSDAAGAEWDDIIITIQPSVSVNSDGTVLADLKQIDEQATNGNNATLNLKQLSIKAYEEGVIAVDIFSQYSKAIFVKSQGNDAVYFSCQAVGDYAGLVVEGAGYGIEAISNNDDSSAIWARSFGVNGYGANLIGAGIGASINAPDDIAVSDGDLTLAAIADAAWDETLTDHLGAGSTGEKLNAAGAAGDPWSTALPGLYAPGTAGEIVGSNLDAAISSRAVAGDAMTLTGAYDPAKTAAQAGDAMTLTSGERDDIASAALDLAGAIESNVTLREALRLIVAATAGKLSGAATATITIRNARADDKDRIIATVDADGNRTAITYDVS